MAGIYFTCNGVRLPSLTGHSESLESLWSSNTGRGTTGEMIGDIIAEKRTHSVSWSFITEEEKELIETYLPTKDQGFAEVTVTKEYGTTVKEVTINAYRSNISAETAGVYGGEYYYSTVATDIIEA